MVPVSSPDGDTGKQNKKRLSRAKVIMLGLTGLLVVVAPLSANAGLSKAGMKAFALDLLQKAEISGESNRGTNSQTIALLTPVSRPDPENARGGGDITIVEESALLPESGPMGTAADIDGMSGSGTISLYVVRKGDTLGEIARMYGVSTNTIRWANDISGGLREGQSLLILPVSGVRHVAKKGDTLASVAKMHNADLQEVATFNDLPLDAKLAAGDVVIVPNGEVTVPEVSTKTRVAKGNPLRGASGLPAYGGYYADPLPGHTKTQGLHGWNGVDLATYYGAPVLAAANGVVIVARESGWNGGYGSYVVIAHENGTQTLYGHLSSLAVQSGETVTQGQHIGNEGNSGRSTGPHLHFEVRGAKNPF